MALINEGFNSLGFKPISRGDESDEEEEDDFRTEMYRNRPVFQQRKVADSDISQEHQRKGYAGMKAVFALKHIISTNEEQRENTVAVQTEMNWVATQVRDLLWDLKTLVLRDPAADQAALQIEVLTFLEEELPHFLSE
jgi:hypothetical protein